MGSGLLASRAGYHDGSPGSGPASPMGQSASTSGVNCRPCGVTSRVGAEEGNGEGVGGAEEGNREGVGITGEGNGDGVGSGDLAARVVMLWATLGDVDGDGKNSGVLGRAAVAATNGDSVG